MNNTDFLKRIVTLFVVLAIAFSLTACGEKPAKTEANGYADQSAFLKDMAKGISARLKHQAGKKELTPEEQSAYYIELVSYELNAISKYDPLLFQDNVFNELAHTYINGCKTQLFSAQNYKNSNLYPSLWNAGGSTRSAVIMELYARYDLPLSGEEASNYSVDYYGGTGGYTISIEPSSGTSSDQTGKTPYKLGEIVSKSCEKGEAKLSLDDATVRGTQVLWTATNHGELGFSNESCFWEIQFFDSDGYALGRNAISELADPLKPGATVNYSRDYSPFSFADKIAFICIEYMTFYGSENSWGKDTRVVFNYAFDLAGNQIDYYSLIH